jgi:3-oxoacyl-[acyl-carrier-protein] synthase-3
MNPMNACLKAVSGYLPQGVLTNDDLGALFPGIRVDDLTRLTGVKSRHISLPDETAVDMAVEAGKNLFREHSIQPKDIDFVLLNTQWPDYITPTSACVVQDRLQLPQIAGALDISQGCTGYIYGLAVAKGMVGSGSAKNVLLLTSETITKSIHENDHSNRAIFGDGATASLISASEEKKGEIGSFSLGSDGKRYQDIIIRAGGARKPFATSTGDSTIRESVPREDLFFMNGPAVFSFSVNVTPGLIGDTLLKNQVKMEEIDLFVFHQANQIILETILRKNRIPQEKSIIHLEEVGNTVSSTIPFALMQAMKEGRIQPGTKVLLAAFGVGLSWGGTVVQF